MDATANISFLVAFTAGFLSFVSPCVLPLVPSYVSFITGMSFEDITNAQIKNRIRKTTALHSIFFIIGFSMVFVTLGASATSIGRFMNQNMTLLQKIGGIVVILLGLHFTGLLSFNFLHREKRFHLKDKPVGYAGSTLVGVSFAIGWTPCIGPILSAILMYAATADNVGHGMALLFAYSMGLGIPFLISAMAINSFLSAFKKITPYMRTMMVVSGVFMIGVGLLIFTNNFTILSQYLTIWYEG
ncbi:MAG: cytochrome c biogenesis CcdA family protein [Thermodesulfobacteriota bacterium]